MNKKVLVLTAAIAALGLSACGSSATEAQRKDAMKALNAFSPNSTSSRAGRVLAANIKGSAWLARFGAEAAADTDVSVDFCSGFQAAEGSGCTATCANSGSFNLNCTLPDSYEESCKGTTYKYSQGTFSFGMSFTSTALSMNLDMSTNITGGELKGGKLACKFAISLTQASLASGSAPEPGCDNFSCSYDGADISCEDLKAAMKDDSTSCGSTSLFNMGSSSSSDETETL